MRSLAPLTLVLLSIAGGSGCSERAVRDARGLLAPRALAAADVLAMDAEEPSIIAVTPAETTIVVGDTLRLTSLIGVGSAEEANTVWPAEFRVESGPISLADAEGLVRADSAGEGEVSASLSGLVAYARVHVVAPPDAPDDSTDAGEVPDDTTSGPVSPPDGVAATRPTLPRLLDLGAIAFRSAGRGQTIRVADGQNLQRALDQAQPGDEILLARGATFRGSFRLSRKDLPGGELSGRWITVRTDLGSDSLPTGSRLTPEDAQRLRLARLVGVGDPASATITTGPGARGWRFVDLEVTVEPSRARATTIVKLGDNDQRVVDEIAGDLVFDRLWVHGAPETDVIRCFLLNSSRTAVVNSTVDECHAKGFDSYAVGGVAGPGPFKIVNNYLAGGGMGIFFGGADPRIPDMSPADIEIRGNHVTRPVAWKGRWTVKNLLEFKHGKRVLIEGNLFENNWVSGQAGTAILFKSVSQYGRAPWSQTADVTFRYNVVRNSPAGITVAAHPERHPAQPTQRVAIEDNLFYNIGEFEGTQSGRMLTLVGPLADVIVARNTMLHNERATHAIILDGSPSRNVEMVGNLLTRGTFGVWASKAREGAPALEKTWPGSWTFRDNVLVARNSAARADYPTTSQVLVRAVPGAQLLGAGLPAVRSLLDGVGGGRAGVDVPALTAHLAGVSAEFPGRPAASAAPAQRRSPAPAARPRGRP